MDFRIKLSSTGGDRFPVCHRGAGVVLATVALARLVAAQSVEGWTSDSVPPSASASLAPDRLTESDWSSIRAAHEEWRHQAFEVEGGYRARNPGNAWTVDFDGTGFVAIPDHGDWSWGLALSSYGFAGHERIVAAPASMRAEGSRVAYRWDDVVEEWYVNESRGLEHGFTVLERPAGGDSTLEVEPSDGDSRAALAFTLAVRGDLESLVEEDGRGARFSYRGGAPILSYRGLVVRDAAGRELGARISAIDDCIRIEIDAADERTAQYPVTIDPIAQQAYVKASNPGSNDYFGWSVSVSGESVVVGAPREDSAATGVNGNQADNTLPQAGAAYVFVRSGGAWSQQAYVKASNPELGDQFGYSVTLSGGTLVVGAPFEDSAATGVEGNQSDNSAISSGAAYVFVRSGTAWSQQAYVKASNSESGDQFGQSVAVAGDTVLVGAYREASNATGVDGDQANNLGTGSGAAYVFVRNAGTWSQQAYLKASNTDPGDRFGYSVDVTADTVVVGAPYEASAATGVNGNQASNAAITAGAAYVFTRSGSTWSQQAYLKASNTGAGDEFGNSVAISVETIVVGAPDEDSAASSVDGNQADESASSAGASYVFARTGTVWAQQAYLKASNPDAEDEFGVSVALSGDAAVIGAFGEDSTASGVNGDGSDDGAPSSGAAYVFARSGGAWSHFAYLKSSNTGGGDEFGFSVGVSGGIAVVGARYEDSLASGVNGNQADNGALDAGAGYVLDVCTTTASATPYGSGKTGAFGVPQLSSTTPTYGATVPLTLSGGLPGAATVILFAGFAPASLAFDGGALLVNPAIIASLPPLDGTGALTLPVPLAGLPCGLQFYMQAMFVDAGAAGYYHTAQTNALAWTIGN